MAKPITLQDIADLCRLSKSMVAKIIRDPDNSKASAATRRRVLDAARTLHYRPNAAAQMLATNRFRTAGLLLPADDPAWWRLMVELDAEFRRRGYFMQTAFWRNDGEDSLAAAAERLLARGMDVMLASRSDEIFDEAPIPVLLCTATAEAAPLAALAIARIS